MLCQSRPMLCLPIALLVFGTTSISTTAADLNKDLRKAAEKGDNSKLKILLDAGAQINSTDKAGRTALYKAAEKGHLETVKLLLRAKADRTIEDNKGFTASFKILLKKGKTYNEIKAPLDLARAAMSGDLDAIAFNISIGADFDILEECNLVQNDSYCTPLMTAVVFNEQSVIDLLIKGGVDVNKQVPMLSLKGEIKEIPSDRYTYIVRLEPVGPNALAVAVNKEKPNIKIIEMLLNAGANPNAEYVCKQLDIRQPSSVLSESRFDPKKPYDLTINYDVNHTLASKPYGNGDIQITHWLLPIKEKRCNIVNIARDLGYTEIVDLLTKFMSTTRSNR